MARESVTFVRITANEEGIEREPAAVRAGFHSRVIISLFRAARVPGLLHVLARFRLFSCFFVLFDINAAPLCRKSSRGLASKRLRRDHLSCSPLSRYFRLPVLAFDCLSRAIIDCIAATPYPLVSRLVYFCTSSLIPGGGRVGTWRRRRPALGNASPRLR